MRWNNACSALARSRFSLTGKIKIGFTDCTDKRWETLETGPEDYELLLSLRGDRRKEKSIHNRFKHLRFKKERFEPEKELIDHIEGFTPDVLEENERLRKKLELAEKRAEHAEEKALVEIKTKVLKAFGEETPKKEGKPPTGETAYFRTSVRGTREEPAVEVVGRLVNDENIWAFSEGKGKKC